MDRDGGEAQAKKGEIKQQKIKVPKECGSPGGWTQEGDTGGGWGKGGEIE